MPRKAPDAQSEPSLPHGSQASTAPEQLTDGRQLRQGLDWRRRTAHLAGRASLPSRRASKRRRRRRRSPYPKRRNQRMMAWRHRRRVSSSFKNKAMWLYLQQRPLPSPVRPGIKTQWGRGGPWRPARQSARHGDSKASSAAWHANPLTPWMNQDVPTVPILIQWKLEGSSRSYETRPRRSVGEPSGSPIEVMRSAIPM